MKVFRYMTKRAGEELSTVLPKIIKCNDNPADSLKIVSWNVAGINACLKKGFHKYITAEKPDILCLQETKLQKNDQYMSYTEYPHQYQSHSKVKKGYSGTAIFSKIKPIKVEYGIGDDLDEEGRYITIEFNDYVLINGYVPNAGSKLERLDLKSKHYINLIENLKKWKKPLIFCGDLNVAHKEIDLARPKNNLKYLKLTRTAGYTPQERKDFTTLLDECKLIDTFRELHPDDQQYTYYSYRFNCRSKNLGWRLDYFLVSGSLKDRVVESSIRNDIYGASDHVPLVMFLSNKLN
jgi:exodeoxyribonuclease III